MTTDIATLQIVHLVDDDDSLRKAVGRLLRTAGFSVRSYSSAAGFLMEEDGSARGCIVLDVRMPGGPSGIELQTALARRGSAMPIIFLTGHGDIPMSVQAIKNGAADFLTKPVKREILIAAVTAAMEKEASVWGSSEKLRDLRKRRANLTRSEFEVYQRVVAGQPNKQITGELKCSERTVKAHRASAMTKMGAGSLAELVHLSDLLEGE